jgi:predicted Ser/Thr protein kinase
MDLAGELRTGDPERVGPYRVLRRLGTGGMGQVYLARSPGGRAVAIKVIRPELAVKHGFRARFGREVTAARAVSGFFTAAVVDADPDAQLPWMATAYVDGPSLADLVEDRGPLSVKAVVSLAAGLAEGLQAIHRTGLVHRDLKPSNVLLASDGPRVIDFGISWLGEADRLTDEGIVVGSPGFLSPEQARGREVGPASDVFCLGAVLSYAATGFGPFGDGPTQALLYRVVHEPPDLSLVPPALRRLIGGCLAKEPDHRPTTSDLLEQIANLYGPPGQDASPGTGQLGVPGGRAGVPATGDRLPDAGSAEPGTRQLSSFPDPATVGGHRPPGAAPAPTVQDRALPERRGRRWRWPLVAALACLAAVAGTAVVLTSSGGRPGHPAIPVTSVSPVTPGTHGGLAPGGTRGPTTGTSASPGSHRTSAAPPATASRPRTPPATPTVPATSATSPAHSTAPAPPPATPTAGGPTPATPTPTPSPTRSCLLLCLG